MSYYCCNECHEEIEEDNILESEIYNEPNCPECGSSDIEFIKDEVRVKICENCLCANEPESEKCACCREDI